MPEIKSLKTCPQCKSSFKEMLDEGIQYECKSILWIIGLKAGALTANGTCASNGIDVYNEWREEHLNKVKEKEKKK